MTASRARHLAALVALLLASATAAPTLAQGKGKADAGKAQCFDAYESAQRLRKAGQLIRAREQLIACALDSCPELTRPDCVNWLREVDQLMPTVILRARDVDGMDVVDVRVALDGQPWLERLDGKAMPLDPGTHMLRVEPRDSPAFEREIVIVQGERDRIITIKIAPAESKQKSGRAPPAATEPSSEPSPTGPIVLGAFGLVALGVGVYFEAKGISDRNELFDTCAPNCPESDVDDAYRKLLIGDIAGAVGLASLAGAAVWYFSTPSSRETPRTGAIRGSFGVANGGGFAVIGGGF